MAIFLTTFFLVFILICAKNIRYGIYAIIFSMPLYLIRFSIFGIPITVLEIMIYILFLTWILNKITVNRKMPPFVISKRSDSGVRNPLNLFFALNLAKRFLLLLCFSRNDKNKTESSHQNFVLLIGMILLFLGLVLSILHSVDLRTSLGIGKGWFFDPLLFFIVFISVIKKTRHIELSFASWVFSGVAVSLISIVYLLNNELTFDGRLKAFYISPNYLAMYLAPVFLIMLFSLLHNKKVSSIKYQVSSVSILMTIFIPLFFTYSYGAFLGIFAGVIWLFYKTQTCHSDQTMTGVSGGICKRIKCVSKVVFKSKYNCVCRFLRSIPLLSSLHFSRNDKGGKIPAQSLLKILAFAILITFVFITAVKFNQIANSENRSSFHSRLMIWNASVEIIKDNPVFGIGPGTFQEVYLSYSQKFDEPYLEWAVTQPHNTFLAFYLQTGLLGFVGFILILFWFFYLGLKRKNNNSQYLCLSDRQTIFNIPMALMIYVLIHGLVDTMYWKNDLSLMFWLVVGLLLTSSGICDTMTSQNKKTKY